jgi:hypothetical protein
MGFELKDKKQDIDQEENLFQSISEPVCLHMHGKLTTLVARLIFKDCSSAWR